MGLTGCACDAYAFGSEPTYEGLKDADRVAAVLQGLGSEPTYEGLKDGYLPVSCHSELNVRSLPTRD